MQSFLHYFVEWRGCDIKYKDKSICKATAYWGIASGRVKARDLSIADKPGWRKGVLVSAIDYKLWCVKQKSLHC